MDLAAVSLALALLPASPKLGADGLPAGWEPLVFKKVERHTSYRWLPEERAIHARGSASASGLIHRLSLDAAQAPILRWRWKVSGVLPKGDERRKAGDDYAARVYVTFRYDPKRAPAGLRFKYGLAKALYGEHPPHAGINYIWANKLPKGESLPNAYTERVMMVALRSGNAEAGRWFAEERNVLEDYRRLYGEEPPPIAGIAIMTDADNTGGEAEAWYADIGLHPAKP